MSRSCRLTSSLPWRLHCVVEQLYIILYRNVSVWDEKPGNIATHSSRAREKTHGFAAYQDIDRYKTNRLSATAMQRPIMRSFIIQL
jgi:hypothetical protein